MQNDAYKYNFISETDVTKVYEKKIFDLLDARCDYFLLVFIHEYQDIINELVKQFDEHDILEKGYIQHLPRYRTNKKPALKLKYSKRLTKCIKSFFESEHYFPFFEKQMDCVYYDMENQCLLTRIGEYQGLYILKRLNFMPI